MRDATSVWALRATWAALALTAAPLLSDGLSGARDSLVTAVAVAAWTAWGVGLVATLVPHPISLTVVRVLAPAAVAAAAWAAAEGAGAGVAAAGLGTAGLAAVVALSPGVGAVFVDGASYGREWRSPLRVPGPLVLGPIPLAWAATVGSATAGPLLLADQRWVAGTSLTVVGLPVAAYAARALHGLARRWLVFVPAGLVLHDPAALADPVLFRREAISALSPALAGTDAEDLTLGSVGPALELRFGAPQTISRRGARRASAELEHVSAILFAPTRLGPVLHQAAQRRLPVGQPG